MSTASIVWLCGWATAIGFSVARKSVARTAGRDIALAVAAAVWPVMLCAVLWVAVNRLADVLAENERDRR